MIQARSTPSNAVLVGGALPSNIVALHAVVSAAASRWQLQFAQALAREWAGSFTCISYVPLLGSEQTSLEESSHNAVRIVPVARRLVRGGLVGYAWRVVHTWRAVPEKVDCVFCYNPLAVTAPWALLLAIRFRAPLIMILADLEPGRLPRRGRSLHWL